MKHLFPTRFETEANSTLSPIHSHHSSSSIVYGVNVVSAQNDQMLKMNAHCEICQKYQLDKSLCADKQSVINWIYAITIFHCRKGQSFMEILH